MSKLPPLPNRSAFITISFMTGQCNALPCSVPRLVGGPVEPGGDVVADEDHAGAAVPRRRAGLPQDAAGGAEGVEPLLHQGTQMAKINMV